MHTIIEKDFGALILDEAGNVFNFHSCNSGEGFVYKDSEAFRSGNGICYISEYGLEELNENLTDLEARYENSDMTDDEYRAERAEILARCGETRQTIIDQVREAFGDDYCMTEAQVEYFAEDVFGLADWAYISTYLAENFEMEDTIEYDEITGRGIFTGFQHDAVAEGMTPKEYKEHLDAQWKHQNAIPEK